MVCEATDTPLAAPGRPGGFDAAPWEHGDRSGRPDPEERRLAGTVWAPEERCQNLPLKERRVTLNPVAKPGSLVGVVVHPGNGWTRSHLLVRDPTGAVVRESILISDFAFPAVGFEVHGLPAGSYTLEVRAPGFCWELRHGVRVEASCVTDVGTVCLKRATGSPIVVPYPHGEIERRFRARRIAVRA